ncbi:uncharacterized protein FIBRA_09362 [Fibroporia radiculosa]|uniref:Uncharacterized protein n=1 Tax=Fibroporia radiculosa TaxID=599839 RepID=J7RHH1_9APHY|nr:uncharacterized protein FIBRA_09362 [Fibroporia radiculosa]CCM07042.1 predicted protein [Fibroporia radiculosa]
MVLLLCSQGGNGLKGAAHSLWSPSEIELLTLDLVLITVEEAIGSSAISPVAVTYSSGESSLQARTLIPASISPSARSRKSGQCWLSWYVGGGGRYGGGGGEYWGTGVPVGSTASGENDGVWVKLKSFGLLPDYSN